jgi:hypothetical protein
MYLNFFLEQELFDCINSAICFFNNFKPCKKIVFELKMYTWKHIVYSVAAALDSSVDIYKYVYLWVVTLYLDIFSPWPKFCRKILKNLINSKCRFHKRMEHWLLSYCGSLHRNIGQIISFHVSCSGGPGLWITCSWSQNWSKMKHLKQTMNHFSSNHYIIVTNISFVTSPLAW